VEIGPVGHGIGIAEPVAEFLADGKRGHLTGIDRIHHDQTFGEHRSASHALADSEYVERSKGVRSELETRTDLGNLATLLEQADGDAEPRKRQGSGKAADAAANDYYPDRAVWR
jgi:hypothetical protein